MNLSDRNIRNRHVLGMISSTGKFGSEFVARGRRWSPTSKHGCRRPTSGRTDMAKKRDTARKEAKLAEKKALSRRDFFKSGAAAGVGAAVLSGAGEARAPGIRWNYEVDVVVLGSGCVGLHAAVRARDLGASVLVIDQNFDVGGKLVHSGGWTSLGGGDAIQERDRTAADPQGLGLTAPLV